MKVEGDVCSEPMGACGPIGSCNQRCKAKWSGGQGTCNLGLCTCNYSCAPIPSPPERKCTSNLGPCNTQCGNACCNSNCASRFVQGIDTRLLGAKPAKTLLDPSVKLHQDTSPPFEDIASYRRLVGKLLYLTTTRPDIAFVTQQLSQFLTSPTQAHYDTACRVVKFLKGSPGRGLYFSRTSKLQLLGFTDANWVGCLDTRRSTSGYCFFLGSSLISWRAKKQHTIARSSSEAEYCALSFAACELQWLAYLLKDLRVSCVKPPVLYCDNQSALHIAANPVFHERTKHLEIDCHFVREKLQQDVFKLLLIHTKSQLADFFTKPLLPKSFQSFISKLNMVDIYHV
ncbi:unnamed protein product [Trifolium pratense]|uniref:Uncharacterized protein n=1 Tax=Trifolium pratense TaxID=57577 RepID=A0ACB0J0R1_TRIPR|nr:unnamed protein product [Trifolium pratense]